MSVAHAMSDTRKLIRLCLILAASTVVSLIATGVAVYSAMSERVVVIGATDTGRFIPVVALDKPFVNEPRVQAYAEECLRRSFAHDFRNFRFTMTQATECYTLNAGILFSQAMQPLLQDLVERRLVMTSVVDQPPVVIKTSLIGGVYTWHLQSKVTLHRDGTRERVPPTSYNVRLMVSRATIEQSPRGILVSFISLEPA